jgi:Mce-associated membrane protein
MKNVKGPMRIVLILSVLLAVAGVGAAGWYGWQWHDAAGGGSADAQQDRDGALKAARQLAVTLQTINPNRPEEGLDSWEAAATGDLLDQLRRDRTKYLDQLKKSPSTSSASVLETALSDLDTSSGTATAITALDVTQSAVVGDNLAAPTTRQLRVKLTLKKTEAGWKASSTSII